MPQVLPLAALDPSLRGSDVKEFGFSSHATETKTQPDPLSLRVARCLGEGDEVG